MKHLPTIKKCMWTLVASAVLWGIGCSKDKTDNNSTNEDGAALKAFLSARDTAGQSFTVPAGGGTFNTSYGNTLIVPAHLFQKKDGSTVTGDYQLILKEIARPSDMIYANKPTLTSDGAFLESYGEFWLAAVQGSDTLVLAQPDSGVVIQLNRAQTVDKIPLWSGDTAVSYSESGYNYLNQAVTETTLFYTNPGVLWQNNGGFTDASSGMQQLNITTLLSWINCDVLVSENGGPRTTVLGYMGTYFNDATLSSMSANEPSVLFFKPDNSNTVVKLYDKILSAPEAYKGLMSYQNSVPVGMSGKMLAISHKNGNFYAEMQEVTIANNQTDYMTIQFNLAQVTESQLESMITSLNQ